MGRNVRLVQSGGMNNRMRSGHTLLDEVTIGNRADAVGERRWIEIHAQYRAMLRAQGPDHRLAKMPCAAGY
jgi:hypothetical protein